MESTFNEVLIFVFGKLSSDKGGLDRRFGPLLSPKVKVSGDMIAPLGILRFLYVGSSDVGRDLDYYTKVLGATKIWDFTNFGTRVAALHVSGGPLFLLAGHRPAPSCLPVFQVEDLNASAKEFKARGWRAEGERFEIPNGPCYLFRDPSGNQIAIFQDVRPGLLGTLTRNPSYSGQK